MDLKEFFNKINLVLNEDEQILFEGASFAYEPEYSETNKKLRVFIKIKNFLPISVLSKVETVFLNNEYLPTKINLLVENQNINSDLIWNYIEYIKDNKAQVISSGARLIKYNNYEFNSENKIVYLKVANEIELKLLESHLLFYQNKLIKYGFSNIKVIIEMDQEIKKEYVKQVEENLKEIEDKVIKQNLFVEKELQNQIQTTNKNFKNRERYSNPSLEKPSYDSLSDIEQNAQNIILHGKIFKKNKRTAKNGRHIFDIYITDYTSSVQCMLFTKNNDWVPFDEIPQDAENDLDYLKSSVIKEEDWVSLKGNYTYSSYDNGYVFYIDKYQKINSKDIEIIDDAEEKRVELHLHTKMSVMDGVTDVTDYIKRVSKWNWKALAITDHLNVQCFPDAFNALKSINKNKKENEKMKLLYGAEINVIDSDIWYVKNAKHEKLRESTFVVFDLETTGLSPEHDEIIEFGANIYNYTTGSSTKHDILIKPKKPISSFTTGLTNITNDMLENKEPIEIAFKKIYELIQGGTLVAHNANFDFNFLDVTAQKLGYPPLKNTVIDTLTIARLLTPKSKNHRLGTVAKNYNIIYDEKIAHRADYDAEVLTHVFEHMWKQAKTLEEIVYDEDWNKLAPKERKENANFIKGRGHHMNIIAKNQEGLKDLYKIISISHTDSFLGSPKLFTDDLLKIREKNNILIGSSCLNGFIFDMARTGTNDMLINAISMFDFVEVQPLSVFKHLIQKEDLTWDQLKDMIKTIITEAKVQNKLVVATSDAHYLDKSLKKIRDIYIHTKGLGGMNHPLYDFKQRVNDYPEQHLRTTTEMLKEWTWLEDTELIYEICITNTNKIAELVDADIKPIRSGNYPPVIENADKQLKEECYRNARNMYGDDLPKIVEERLEKELNSIIKHGFAVIYWISHLLVKKSLDDGYLVGSRGSVGSSFVATTSNITEVNPLKAHYRCDECCFSDFETPIEFKCGYDLPKRNCPNCSKELIGDGHDIPFETFLGFDGDKVPDIDLNFSGEYQPRAHDFTKEMFGERNVYRAGTISTVAEKTAYGYVMGYLEKTMGTVDGFPKAEIDRLASFVTGTKRTTGQHPGGIIILPNEYEIEDFTPVNYPADDVTSSWKTTHFDFNSIHDNLLKMDILGHVDPTALRMLQDLTGIDPKKIPTNDKNVYDVFTSSIPLGIEDNAKIEGETTGAIGLPEFGTNFVRGMLRDTKPKTFADLVQLSGLSHGTDVYLGNAQTLILNGTASISTVIGCRDEIMVYLLSKGLETSLSFTIMESVRKGKGLNTKWIEEMKAHDVPDWYIDSCTKIKYMFPKAHATAYVLMAYRVAWFKIYYPIEYYTTFLSTRIDAFDLETVIKGEDEVRKSYREIKRKLQNHEPVSTKENQLISTYEVLLEMFSRGIKIMNIDFKISEASRFVIGELENGSRAIYAPFNTIDTLGETAANSIINARNEKQIKSVDDLKRRTQVTQTQLNTFKKLKILDSLIDDEQISFNF